MKKFVIILLFSYPIISPAQSLKIETLLIQEKQLTNEIAILNDSLSTLRKQIQQLRYNEQPNKLEPVRAATKGIAVLKDAPNKDGKVVMRTEKTAYLKLYSFKDGYYEVCIKDVCGYMHEMYIQGTTFKVKQDFLAEKREIEEIEKEERLAEEEVLRDKDREESNKRRTEQRQIKEQKMVSKYGKETVEKMKDGKVWIGMNEEQLEYAYGKPKDKNRTVGSWGVHEQWVYNSVYFYFENGKLTSWQD